MHVRLQTRLPFQIKVVLNGRDWLARQLDAAGIGYLKKDNTFVALDDFGALKPCSMRSCGSTGG